MGFDTECDLGLEASTRRRSAPRSAGVRNRLVAEHWGVGPKRWKLHSQRASPCSRHWSGRRARSASAPRGYCRATGAESQRSAADASRRRPGPSANAVTRARRDVAPVAREDPVEASEILIELGDPERT